MVFTTARTTFFHACKRRLFWPCWNEGKAAVACIINWTRLGGCSLWICAEIASLDGHGRVRKASYTQLAIGQCLSYHVPRCCDWPLEKQGKIVMLSVVALTITSFSLISQCRSARLLRLTSASTIEFIATISQHAGAVNCDWLVPFPSQKSLL